jgi:hypothetical protein
MKRNHNEVQWLCYGSPNTGTFDTENDKPFDLPLWAGVILTEQQAKLLWRDNTAFELLCECPSAVVTVEKQDDENHIDDGSWTYWVQYTDEETLKREVRDEIWMRI